MDGKVLDQFFVSWVYLLWKVRYLIRGGYLGPKSALLCMLLAHVCHGLNKLQCSALLYLAPQLVKSNLRHTFLVSNGVHPTFPATSPHLTTHSPKLGDFRWYGVLLTNRYNCKRSGVKRRNSWSYVQFQPFPSKIQHLGVTKMVKVWSPPNLTYNTWYGLIP